MTAASSRKRRVFWQRVLALLLVAGVARAGIALRASSLAAQETFRHELLLLTADRVLVAMHDSLERYAARAATRRAAEEALWFEVRSPEAGHAETLQHVERIAELCGFALAQIGPQPDAPASQGVATVRIEGSGSFRASLLFLHRLEAGPGLFEIQDITISQDAPAPETAELLHISAVVSSHYRILK